MDDTATLEADLLYEVSDGIGRITFNRPQARNALTFNMYRRLAEICMAAGSDRSLKVLILTGAGDKAFASGTDINQFRAFSSPQDAIDYETRIDQVLGTLEQCQVPIIAAINGVCAGGGAGIAACCDIRIGTRNAKFGFPIARTLGNCLSMSNLGRLSRLIRAARLVASHAPLTLRATKQALLRMQPEVREDEELILMCYQSRDFREGMDAFLNKRQPQWTGE